MFCASAQTPSVSNFSETFSNFKAELGSGNFVYSIPLFSMETVNPGFTFTGSMWYNAQAASTVFTSDTPLSRGWSLDFIPSISRNIHAGNSLWDEKYYEPNTNDTNYFTPGYNRPTREYNDLFEFSAFGLRGSFRLVYSTTGVQVVMIDCNEAVDITPVATVSTTGNGKKINLVSFTLTDKDGFRYEFSEAEEGTINQKLDDAYSKLLAPFFYLNGGLFVGELPYKKSFLLKNLYDKHNRTLLTYDYTSTPVNFYYKSYLQTYNKKELQKIKVVDKGVVSFELQDAIIKSLTVRNNQNEQIRKIEFNRAHTFFYDAQGTLAERYLFTYRQSGSVSQYNNYGNPLKTTNLSTICTDADAKYNNEVQDYTNGVLKTIETPFGGKINIEYETNTYSYFKLPGEGVGSIADAYLFNKLNFQYVDVPVSINNKFYYESGNEYYVKFDSQYYENPNLFPPQGFYPGVRILTATGAVHQGFDYLNLCEYGTKVNFLSPSQMVTVSAQPNYQSYVSNIRVYKKVLKPVAEHVKYLFGPSIRVKKITYSNASNTVLNEQLYGYQNPADSSVSSGIISAMNWDSYSSGVSNIYGKKPFPVFYNYITVEEAGKGKTVYELNTEQFRNTKFGVPQVAFQPKNTWKYNESGQLQEQVSNTFEYFQLSTDPGAKNQLKKITSNIVSYEGAQSKSLTSERLFDTASRQLSNSKISDTGSGDVFEEKYTYQKLGNALYQTGVEKTRNNAALNKSSFAYQQQGSTPVYNLKTVSSAKEARPLETEREITRYDDYGNVVEYKTKDGLVVSQIWGYNDSRLVAELKNVNYSDIADATLTGIRTASAADTYNETDLQGYLNGPSGLRTLHPGGFITTYTYKPLTGITSITDANGRKETYEYDRYSRLLRVLNHEGLITKEYKYNIKN